MSRECRPSGQTGEESIDQVIHHLGFPTEMLHPLRPGAGARACRQIERAFLRRPGRLVFWGYELRWPAMFAYESIEASVILHDLASQYPRMYLVVETHEDYHARMRVYEGTAQAISALLDEASLTEWAVAPPALTWLLCTTDDGGLAAIGWQVMRRLRSLATETYTNRPSKGALSE